MATARHTAAAQRIGIEWRPTVGLVTIRLLTCACCPTCCPSVANDRTKKLYLLIKCTRPSYAAWAEHMGLKQSRRTSVLREEFRKDMQSQFEPFRSLEKQQILFALVIPCLSQ